MSEADAIEDIYELAPMQHGMLFHSLLEPSAGMYVEQLSCEVRGKLPLEQWKAAWQHVLGRHAILRSSFLWEGLEKPVQVVAARAELPWHLEDLRGLSGEEQEARIDSFLREDRLRGFELGTPPLLRCALLRLGEERYRFVWTYHHLLLDGWCFSIVLREVLEAYAGGVESLPPPARPYRDYITWLQEQQPARAESFWRELLRGFEQPTPLPFVERREASEAAHGAQPEHVRRLPRELTARLTAFAKEHRLTLNTLVQGAWALVLGRTAGTNDVIFGVTISGRPSELVGSESIVGLFINTVPLRARLDDGATVPSFLSGLQARQSSVEPYGYVSLADIQLWSDAPHDRPLFESLLVFENYPIDRSTLLERSGLVISSINAHERINYPLAVVAIPGESLELRVMYQADMLSHAAAERVGRLLEAALGALTTAKKVGEIDFLDEAARRVLAEWGQNRRAFEPRAPIHEQVAQVARRTPEALALVGADGRRLTYHELDLHAERVARRLRLLGIGRETLVGVCIGKSVELVVGLLGVLKAGAAYLPIDPNYPQERLAFLVGDASPAAILHVGADPIPDTRIPRLDVARISRETEAPGAPAPEPARVDDLAYVIYTSGSTGTPKGVLISHRSLLNLISWHTEAFGLTAKDRTTQLASIAFDAAVWEIWPTLAAGGSLHVVPPELIASPAELSRWLVERQITVSFLPTAVAEAALSLPWPGVCALRFMLTGGDRLHVVPPRGLPFKLVNNYGPTETTVVATSGVVDPESREGLPSIGRPVANARIYILDRLRRPVLPGVIGELYIGGAGVARGYLRRPELSATRFVPDPFSEVPAARMYASGDLARFLPDGTLAFHGRVDRQLQVRGVRVEPGEIEATLAEHPGVSAAAVVGEDRLGNGDIRLVAFAACEPEGPLDAAALASYLGKRLPEVMVPKQIILVSELPLTPNGKVDYAALEARASQEHAQAEHIAPRTPHEEILAGIWSAVLGQERIGVEEDFFALGGHSLKATQVIARAREAFGVDLPVRTIFERRTIALLAEAVAGHSGSTEPIPRIELSGEVPLSPGQESLWFIEALGGGAAAYNVPLVIQLHGALDASAVARALALLVERHEALRTTFHERAGAPVQRIGPPPSSVLTQEDVTPERLEQRIAEEIATPFSLTTGPLFRARLFRVTPEAHTLVINQHHIIVDAWSLGVVLREFCIAYAAFSAGEVPELPEPPIRYADWVAWQRQRLAAGRLEEGLAYWRQTLQGAPEELTLPSDRPRPTVQSFRGRTHSFVLAGPVGRRLEALARGSGASLFMTLLGAFAAYLGRISGQEDIVIGSPAANRDRHETEGVVGYFLNTLALRVDLSGDPPFNELLQRVRKAALDGYAYQDIPFEQVVAALQRPHAVSHNPLFQVMFVLQGQSGGELQLPGVRATLPVPEGRTSKFDLTFFVEPREDGLACLLEYNTDLFDALRISRMAAHLGRVLEAVAEEPELRVSELPLLSPEERAKLLPGAPRQMPHLPAVHEVIAAQASKTPKAIAVEAEEGTLTYEELEARAGAVAHELVRRGVTPGTLVAIAVERSLAMMTGVLGILKAGAAYVPLDPAYPRERLALMLKDSGARVVLTQEHLAPMFPESEVLVPGKAEQRSFEARTGALAYCLYTSGSTGQPKGVLIEHPSLANHMEWMRQDLPLTPEDRVLQRTSLSFDASVWELFAPLMVGARLVLAPHGLGADTEHLARVLRERAITVLQLVPSLLTALVEEPGLAGVTMLRRVCVGGEPLPSATVRKLFALHEKIEVWNLYGPTEATIDVTAHRCRPEAVGPPGATEPIGLPILHMEALILDEKLRPVPEGWPGELYLAGPGLARGYLNRPELTGARFIEHTFPGGLRLRMYKTGDVVQRLADGALLFTGRADRQIKLRGYRLELGEVEAALSRHPAVREAVALVRGSGGDARLMAFVAPSATAKRPEPAELRDFMARQLAAHMVPGQIVVLDALPLAPNGKVNYRALAAMEIAEERPASAGAIPRDAMELALVRLYEEILGTSAVGIHDSFFELGGHSLLALKLKLAVERRLHRPLPLAALFQNPSPARLAAVLRDGGSVASPLIPLTPAAHALLASSPADRGARRTPVLYLVPGGGSTPFYLLPLARHLEGVAVLGLQPRGLDGEAPPHETVEAMAAWYTDAILSVQPEGPYCVGGHSLGGHIAYEIAQELKARGREVALVALLDTLAPFPEATRPLGKGWDTAQWMVHLAGLMEALFSVKIGLELPAVRAVSEAERLPLFVERLKAAGVLPEGAQSTHVQGILNVARAHDALDYRPRRGEPLPLAVFRAEDRAGPPSTAEMEALVADGSLGWSRFTQRPCTAYPVPGTHLTLIREPYVAALARALRERLPHLPGGA